MEGERERVEQIETAMSFTDRIGPNPAAAFPQDGRKKGRCATRCTTPSRFDEEVS